MVGALIGGVVGLFGARLVWGALDGLDIIGEHFVHALVVVFLGYMGVVLGGQKGGVVRARAHHRRLPRLRRLHQYKVLDTSVIIDGRIADICETGFLEGTLVAPQFVLRELQQVADSSDSLKRNRGRRGLDILQKMQKMAGVDVQIVETDFPEIREVDLKLIELARKLGGKIVTNDFNLNKVAQLRGVPVLNINELANSLKPVVLPGELMKVFVIKEGKEQGQGVGYLDDGTMVVVDQAKKALGRTIEVSVTSVLQTTAGKMIFCRWPEAAAFPEEPRRDSRLGDRRDLVRNGRDPRIVGSAGDPSAATESGRAASLRSLPPPPRERWRPRPPTITLPSRGRSRPAGEEPPPFRTASWTVPPPRPSRPGLSRAVLALPLIAAYTFALGLPAIVFSLLGRPRSARRMTAIWAKLVLRSLGVEVTVCGAERCPAGAAVYAANHTSALDIPILFGFLPVDFRIIHKRSLYLVPVLGQYLYVSGHIGIHRGSAFRARKGLEVAAERVRGGTSVVVFPEGTRSPEGDVGTFKRCELPPGSRGRCPRGPDLAGGRERRGRAAACTCKPGACGSSCTRRSRRPAARWRRRGRWRKRCGGW